MRFHLAPKLPFSCLLARALLSPIQIWVWVGCRFLEDSSTVVPPCVIHTHSVLSPYLAWREPSRFCPTTSLPHLHPLSCLPWTSSSPVLSSSVVSASWTPFPAPLHIVLHWSVCPGWSSLGRAPCSFLWAFPDTCVYMCIYVLFSFGKANCRIHNTLHIESLLIEFLLTGIPLEHVNYLIVMWVQLICMNFPHQRAFRHIHCVTWLSWHIWLSLYCFYSYSIKTRPWFSPKPFDLWKVDAPWCHFLAG